MGLHSAGGSQGGGLHSAGSGSSKSTPAQHHSHGLFGLLNNLGSDVKDAVVGLPTGAVQLVEHPVDSAKAIARASWHDWAPLVHGHPIAFAQQTYDHPLAPLLDVATVFSAGAGIGAKLGDAAVEAGSTSRIAKAASDLGKSKARTVTDTKALAEGRAPRPALTKTYSGAAGPSLRRELANRALLHMEPHLPSWFKQTAREGRLYSRLHHVDIAHRVAATNLQINALMRAGKAISDPSLQHIIQPELLSHNYWNLRRYAHKIAVDAPLPTGYTYVREMTSPDMFAAKEGVTLESRMRTFAKDFTNGKRKNAAVVSGGKHNLIVPFHDAHNLALEGENSTRFLRQLAHKPVVLWKRINVGYAPRVITNNAVGNWMMHAMRTGGDGGARGFIDAVKYSQGNRAAMRAFKQMHAAIASGEVPMRAATHSQQVLDRATGTVGPHVAGNTPEGIGGLTDLAHEKGYVYHRASSENFDAIRQQGLKPVKPAGNPAGVYFANHSIDARGLSWKSHKGSIYFRAAKGDIKGLDQSRAFGESLTSHAVPPHHLEYLGSDGKWHAAADRHRTTQVAEATASPAEAAARFTALAHPAITADPNIAAITHAFGARAAAAVKRPPDWVRQNFSDEMGNVFGNVLDDNGKGSKRIKQGFYPIVHRVADQPVRVAALYQFMRRAPEVRAFLKTHPGTQLDTAIQSVLKRNPAKLRERAVSHVRSIAGDYTTMNPTEKLVQNIVPFYLWDKHIAKHFANMVSEKPGRVAAMQLVSRMGNDEAQKLLGDVPEFMKGALPLSLFGMQKHGDRTPLLMTTGLNPYSTIGELTDAATALTTRHDSTSGANAASNLSPILTGLIEQISGHKIGSQAAPARHGGVLPSVLASTFGGTSYGTLLNRIINGTPKPKVDLKGNSKPFLYEKTPGETAKGLFGIPVKNVSLARAHEMAAQDAGTKKKKRGYVTASGG